MRLCTGGASPTVHGTIEVVRAALKAPERGNGDACIGAPRREVLPQLAIPTQRTDLDLHPIPELGKSLLSDSCKACPSRTLDHSEVQRSLGDSRWRWHVPNLWQPLGVRRKDFAQVVFHLAMDVVGDQVHDFRRDDVWHAGLFLIFDVPTHALVNAIEPNDVLRVPVIGVHERAVGDPIGRLDLVRKNLHPSRAAACNSTTNSISADGLMPWFESRFH